MRSTPVAVSVAGGTGSGKTTVVWEIIHALGEGEITVIQHDSYYLVALEKQDNRWPLHRPSHWSTEPGFRTLESV